MNGHTFVGDEVEKEEAQSFADLVYEVDDGFLSISIMQDKHWDGFARATDRPDLTHDPRFRDAKLREIHRQMRIVMTQAAITEFKRDDLIARLEKYGVPCAPVLTRTELRQHPQIESNKTLVEYEHPQAGRLRQARSPAVFKGTPLGDVIPAPALGEHTDSILNELND